MTSLSPGISQPGQDRTALRILFASLVCVGLGQSLLFSVLPPIARTMELAEWHVGLVFAISGGMWAAMSPFWGRRSDIVGRKPIITQGVGTYAVSMLLFTLAIQSGLAGWLPVMVAFPLMIAARLINGVFGSGSFPAAQAYIADRTSRARRTGGISMLNAAFTTGVVLGPGLGALLVGLHLLAPLVAVAIIAACSFVVIALYLPESSPASSRKVMPRVSLLDRRILPFVIGSVVMSICHAASMQTIAFYMMDTLLLDPEETARKVGFGLTLAAVAALVFQIVIVPRLNLGPGFLLKTGGPLALAGFVVILIADSYPLMVTAMMLFGVGMAMLRPGFATAASLAVSPREQGTAAGALIGTGAAGHVLSPLIAMPLYMIWTPGPFVMNALLMAFLVAYVLTEPRIRAVIQRT